MPSINSQWSNSSSSHFGKERVNVIALGWTSPTEVVENDQPNQDVIH